MYSLAKALRLWTAILSVQLVGKGDDRVDSIGDAPPCPLKPSGIALTVDAERSIVSALDEEIPSLVAIRAPRLDRERLVQVVFVSRLFVGLCDYGADRFGRGEGPIDECAKKSKLKMDHASASDSERLGLKLRAVRTRSVGVMEAKVRSPPTGFLPSHCAGHWFRLEATASSKARL